MLVYLSGLVPTLGLQDVRSCVNLSGPKRALLSCLGLRTVFSTLGRIKGVVDVEPDDHAGVSL